MSQRKLAYFTRQIASQGVEWLINETIDQLVFHITIKYRLGNCGSHSVIERPLTVANPRRIMIGEGTRIRRGAVLVVRADPYNGEARGTIQIGNEVYIGRLCQIEANNRIEIQDDTLIADKVFISDHDHAYADVYRPIRYQGWTQGEPIRIGKGSWIGYGACILSGVQIGEHSVVGAGSIVTKNIDSFTVVAGNPARVQKRWDRERLIWTNVSSTNPVNVR